MVEVTDKEKVEALLLDIIGSVLKVESYQHRCHKCKEQKESYAELERHHIVYRSKKLVWLCRKCHDRITYLNGLKARELHRKLNNKDRWDVWREFLKEVTTEEQYLESTKVVAKWFSK